VNKQDRDNTLLPLILDVPYNSHYSLRPDTLSSHSVNELLRLKPNSLISDPNRNEIEERKGAYLDLYLLGLKHL